MRNATVRGTACPASPRVVLAMSALALGVVVAFAVESFCAEPAPLAPLARDEELVLHFNRKVTAVQAHDGIRITTPSGPGVATARGRFIAGRPLIDPSTGRAVVVRPEALREFFVLAQDLSIEDADAEAERVLARVEKTGKLAALDAIDASLRQMFGPSAGTRLDDPTVTAFTPPPVAADSPLAGLRQLLAGDDELWRSYLVGGDINAFTQLSENPGFERFRHAVDPLTGVPDEASTLRRREHRRTLMRRSRGDLTFLPEIPMRPTGLDDASYVAGATYEVKVSRSLSESLRSGRTASGGMLRFIRGLASFTVADDPGDGGVFHGGTPGPAIGPSDPPRVVDMTPPAGEPFLDFSTDWEDPDNQFTVPIPARRNFTIRLRFSKPLDPRTVDPAHFLLTKIDSGVSVPIGVFLSQHRTGEVLVELQPVTHLDPATRYRVQVLATVKALDGTPLGTEFSSEQ